MAFGSQGKGWASRVFVTLTVLALAVRFAIPAGIMLERPAEDGALPDLVICTTAGLITVKAEGLGIPDHAGKADPSKHDGKSGEPCVFAAMAASVPPPAVSVADLPSSIAAPAPLWPAAAPRPGQGLAAPPPPATGPPALV
ncbi:MAG: hypothetical protein AB7O49_12415 [Sphingomonadales bacterium]